MIKINNDLERVGDEAVNNAERYIVMAKQTTVDIRAEYNSMVEKTESMLKSSLDAIVNPDTDLAYKVCLADDEIDDINRKTYDKVKEAILHNPERVGYLINFLPVSRHVERIADHATRISEGGIYMVEGVIHRHSSIQ